MYHREEVWFCEETRQYAVFLWEVDANDDRVGHVRMVEAGSIRQVGGGWIFAQCGRHAGKAVCVGFRRSGQPMRTKDAPQRSARQTFATKRGFDAECRWRCCTVERFAASELEAA